MPKHNKRNKTIYPGVNYEEGVSPSLGTPERVYYVRYRKDGKLIEEKAGRQYQDAMTPAKASVIRAERIRGKELCNTQRREIAKKKKESEKGRYTIERIWREYKRQRVFNKSLSIDDNRFKNHLKPSFGKKEPQEIIQLDVDRLRLKLMKKYNPQSVRHILALLRRLVNFGVKKGLCQNLKFTIEMPPVYNTTTEDLTPGQLNALLQALDESSNTAVASMMKLVLYSGMRRGEIFKLQWGHVDFDRGFIEIVDPKGGPSQKVPLNNAARTLLENYPRTKSEYVFPGKGGKQRTDVNNAANKIKNAAGLPSSFRALHGLRHVYASMLASSGKVDMYTLQKLLTHKSPQMTQRYAHLRDDALKNASEVAANIISDIDRDRKKVQDSIRVRDASIVKMPEKA